jgi:hypothetical protein
MPCHDPRNFETEHERRYELDKVTRAACDMRTILRRHNLLGEVTSETLAWVAQHDMVDAIRIAEEEGRGEREQMKRNALAKLNVDERRVLGL